MRRLAAPRRMQPQPGRATIGFVSRATALDIALALVMLVLALAEADPLDPLHAAAAAAVALRSRRAAARPCRCWGS